MESLRKIYRIGHGPSSSHTIAPQMASHYVLKKHPDADFFKVTLFGSLALTGHGHLTDTIIKKVFKNKRVGIIFDYYKNVIHPNTMLIEVFKENNKIADYNIVSLGGGSFLVNDKQIEKDDNIYPFSNFDEIKEFCKKNNLSLSEFVYKFEDKRIKQYLDKVYKTMESAIKRGLSKDGFLPGGLKVKRKAKLFLNAKENESFDTYKIRKISSYAYATSEENASGGTIVTAPTCGSCGVLPAVLFYLKEINHYSKEEIIDSLAVASLFGNIIKTNASLSGAYAGCQAEIGSACSMSAAACSYLSCASIEEIEYASEIAMEHHLGLTCDPVKGLVQIPCIERNAVAALRAIDASRLASFITSSSQISFDTVVQTMLETGKDLAKEYKETSLGGLARNYKKN